MHKALLRRITRYPMLQGVQRPLVFCCHGMVSIKMPHLTKTNKKAACKCLQAAFLNNSALTSLRFVFQAQTRAMPALLLRF